MDKKKLIPGQKYLHHRKVDIAGRKMEAERWMKCESITKDGAVFSRDFEADIVLTNKEIEEDLQEDYK